MSVTTLTDARSLRPSQVIAEALVDRQAPNQIVARARELGYSNCLTTAVVHACCGQHINSPQRAILQQPAPREQHASS